MDEIDNLMSMWSQKVKRSTKLIIPEVTIKKLSGSLNNDNWVFEVPYAFREALDIKYEERRKDKKPYMVWTQGPIINFKHGDSLTSVKESVCLQVMHANQMGWDSVKREMYQGSVIYDKYEIMNKKYTKIGEGHCSQMEFLKILIYGENYS